MKVIVSHDVDHITAFEHWRDLQIPKSIIRSSIELVKGKISVAEYGLRFHEIGINRLHNLKELMRFDTEYGVPSTFFLAVNHGLGLCYSLRNAAYWAQKIIENGFDVGLHGIEFDDPVSVKQEYDWFTEISKRNNFGIRMHYLRMSEDTIQYLDRAGYDFDSSVYQQENPYKVGNLWEFPLHIMDTYVFNHGRPWQNRTEQQAFDTAIETIENCRSNGINYLTLLLHDRYFSDAFKSWKQWYSRVITYLKDSKAEFVNYRQAIRELEDVS